MSPCFPLAVTRQPCWACSTQACLPYHLPVSCSSFLFCIQNNTQLISLLCGGTSKKAFVAETVLLLLLQTRQTLLAPQQIPVQAVEKEGRTASYSLLFHFKRHSSICCSYCFNLVRSNIRTFVHWAKMKQPQVRSSEDAFTVCRGWWVVGAHLGPVTCLWEVFPGSRPGKMFIFISSANFTL